MSSQLPRQGTHSATESTSAVYLIQHRWHAGIAVRPADVPGIRRPMIDEFSDTDYVEVGWGDADYYPSRDPGPGTFLKAGLWPTQSVLLVRSIPGSVPNVFPRSTIVRVPVGAEALEALETFIRASFAENPVSIRGRFGPGRQFFPSDLPYHAFNNCNHWAAAALEAAGCNASPRWTFTVGQVVDQAMECGVLVQHRNTD